MQTDTPKADPREWRYSINYGPDGEANYAFVYDADGELVSNLRTHHAIAVVDAMNRAASGLSIVPVATGDVGKLVKRLRAVDHTSVEDCFLQSPLLDLAASTLESLAAENARLNEECRLSMHTIADERARFEATNAELRAALEPFAEVAEWDIGESEADDDLFSPMDGRFAVSKRIRVGNLRRAASLLRKGGADV